MKNKEKHYPVNNQEDEDGCIYENVIKEQNIISRNNIANTEHRYAKLRSHSIISSSLAIVSRPDRYRVTGWRMEKPAPHHQNHDEVGTFCGIEMIVHNKKVSIYYLL